MALPNYIQPGLYINGLNGALSEKNIVQYSIPNSNHPKISNILGLEGANTFINMSWHTCTFQPEDSGVRTPGLKITNGTSSTGAADDFLFVRQVPRGIAVGYVDIPLINDTHILSDGFGGCEWHVLSRNYNNKPLVAFLHVYKGMDKNCQYTYDGWEQKAVLYSSSKSEEAKEKLNEFEPLTYSLASYAFIAPGTATIDTCMLIVDNNDGKVMDYMQHKTINI
jgi:hypothetical protein